MSKEESRAIALATARGIASEFHTAPYTVSPDEALLYLDDLSRNSPDLIASIWYQRTTDHQITLFKRDWLSWCKQASADAFERMHRTGAQRFGLDWLRMNLCVQDAAIQQHMDVQAHQTLLTAIAFKCCEAFALTREEKSHHGTLSHLS